MTFHSFVRVTILSVAALSLGACGGIGSGNPFRSSAQPTAEQEQARQENIERQRANTPLGMGEKRETIWDLFTQRDDPNTTVEVNKYLWKASLEVLNFLPIQSVDPFSGVIVTGYGTPPGGGRAYRATVYIQDPALDARSLKLALATRGGAVSPDTVRAVEDAILTRARQLRIQDSKL
ncbi:DUF3576 domain-containing protein [Actibacterium sp. MT2.3-13A]|uniref:DUF3576 domain-containing protein n=1 Tax=Actibacterium sp. MT2.3-13A TaxID=2828332 RepID=UPI001BA4848E|nr:DUF3576 domain-containing protein [Actibacterium sp. MT2.3-13A]